MKRFEFSFQYLLDAHQAREQAAEHALHTAIKEQNAIQQQLADREQYRRKQVEVVQEMTGVLNRPLFASYIRNIGTIQAEQEMLKKKIRSFDEKIKGLRANLQKEMTQRKVYENLREREREEWAFEMQVEDQKQMDELAVGRWSRQERSV